MAEFKPLLDPQMKTPLPQFISAVQTARGPKPQAIAHRGYKAAHPENTMGAFRGAVDVGAHAIETDIHLSKDGVVVLSHDATLKRCFGKEEKIVDCDWAYLETLRTLQAPHEPMPRLKDLLEYLATPGLEDIWVLLDIKVPRPALTEPFKKDRVDQWRKLDNRADDAFRLIAATLADVKPSRPWNERVLVGCWAAKYLPTCAKYLPGYPITHIGFSVAYARQFLKVPGVSFNMMYKIMVGPFGNSFLNDAKKAGRAVFYWTVNDEEWMKWCIRKGINGVITDDPKKYLEVCENYQGEKVRLPFKSWGGLIWMNTLAAVFSLLFRYRYGFKIDATKIRKSLQGNGAIVQA